MSTVLTCPSCGAPVALKYRFSKMVVCESCRQTSFVVNGALEVAGEKAELANYGSKFVKGATGIWKGRKFEILGRVRYEYEGGFWDEWLLLFEGDETEYWLHEDEGDLVLFTKIAVNESLPEFANTKVGKKYQFADKILFTTEKHKAWVLGGEGEMPVQIRKGQRADFIDGIIYVEGKIFSFEFLPAETLFFIGEPVNWRDMNVQMPENQYKQVL